jgi:ER membrane protein complex subunit 1
MLTVGRNSAGLLWMLALLSSGILGTFGLYEDQDGKYNWYQQHVGHYSEVVSCAEIGIGNVGNGGFLVSTHEGVLARISKDDGSVVWRLVLAQGERILPDTLSCGVDYALFVSVAASNQTGTAHILRASSGMQIWEDGIALGGAASMSISPMKRGVLIAAPGVLRFRNLEDGSILWNQDGLLPALSEVKSRGMAGNVVVSAATSQGISLVRLQESDGNAVDREDLKSTRDGSTTVGLVHSGLAHVASDGKHVCFVIFGSGQTCTKVVSDDTDSIQHSRIVGEDVMVVSTTRKTVIIRIDRVSKAPIVDATFDHVYGLISHGANGVVLIASSNANAPGIFKIQYSENDSRQKPSLMQYPVAAPKYVNEGESSLPVAVGLSGTHVLVQFSEGTTLSFSLDTSTKVWQRSESLADITQCMFSELPPSNPENEEEWHSRQPPLSQKLFIQLLILKTQLGMGRPIDTKSIEEHKARTRDILRPTRDIDGFRKQIIVVTGSGKVASLHSGNGAILWQVNFPGTVQEMKVQHWFTSEKQNILSVFMTSGNKLSVYLLDGFTGRVLEEHIQVPYSNDIDILPLDPIITEAGEQSSYVILDGSNNVLKVLPFNDRVALSNFDTVSKHLVHWTVSKDRKSIQGLKLGSLGHQSTLQWKVNIIPDATKMRIVDISYRDKNEAIYSAAKPVFGGGVLMKNINPNTLLVIAGGDKDSSLIVTALDAVTGRIIYRQEHRGGNGPVKSIVSEHWAAYNFWQETQGRWYIGVIDTYYPQPDDLTAMKLLFSRGDANETVSPYDTRPDLIVESESFRTKFAASCLAVTKTSHGTTSKMLLMGTTEGQIVSIDRRMLDPRRPKVLPGTKPTPEQVYERLPPYQPEIGASGPSFITLYHRIERLRGIETHPATLESSTLVFAHGLDTYFIRMQPSRGFDMVPDDFPHALLVVMVVGLALALSILRKIIQKRTLRLTWK